MVDVHSCIARSFRRLEAWSIKDRPKVGVSEGSAEGPLTSACTSAFRVGAVSAETPVNLAFLAGPSTERPLMEAQVLQVLIRQKLADGRLPHNSIPRLYGGPSNGETCGACEEVVEKSALIMEGIAIGGTAPLQMHVQCFYLWDSERRGKDGVVGS